MKDKFHEAICAEGMLKSMKIRSYTAKDDTAAIALWNTTLKEDKINRENFYTRVICDNGFDPNLYLLAEENGELVGFIYGAKSAEKAWIIAMGVDPNHRRKGIGRVLVSAFETATGAKTIDIGGYTGSYFFPGVDQKNYADAIEFFKNLGYGEIGVNASMDLNLREYETPTKYIERRKKLESEGYTFGAFKLEDSLPLFEFFRKHFPYWLDGAKANILRGVGHETIQIAKNPAGEVIGYAMRASDGTPGRFGPFGVSNDQQGTGVGGILFHNLISDMVERRIFYTWFLWTGGRNLDIYAAWGMEQYRVYSRMEKTI